MDTRRLFRKFRASAWLLPLWATASHAWGPIGHRTVAETAALLVQDDLPKTWGPIVARHRFELGVYSYDPDSKFRDMDGNGGNTEAPTHRLYLDPKPGEAPGSVDRRVAQFLDRAKGQFSGVVAPQAGHGRGSTALGEVRHVAAGLYELGVMAHYAGDTTVPYHATSDWNGYERGEGGIHFYFEADCVNALEPGLSTDVLASARKNRAVWLASWSAATVSVPQLIRNVLKDSYAVIPGVASIDKRKLIVKPSPPGTEHNATRVAPAKGCAALRPILVERLAKGAALTAYLWESALPKSADLSGATELHFSDMEQATIYPQPNY
jgi:hypothetical protein